MRYGLLLPCLLACSVNTAVAQVSIGIGLPSVSIGISVPVYPELVPVPGYPVYYAPQMQSNFFFYDGMYWVYQRDAWYASEWYDGPWGLVEPEFVPLYVLRIPVRYYRDPPVYFRGWISNAPPRWGEHWGNDWERRRNGWDRWDRNERPRLAPLPIYQRQYGGDRYPHGEQQRSLRDQNYRYQPRDADVRQHVQDRAPRNAPGQPPQPPQPAQQSQPPQQSQSPRERNGGRPDEQRTNPRQPPQPAPQPQQPQPQPQQPQSPSRGQDRGQPRPPQGAADEGRRPAPVQAQPQPQPQPPPQPQPRTPPNTLPPRDVGRPQTPAPPQREAPAPGAGQKTIPRGEAMPDQRRGQGAERGQNPGQNQGQGQGQGQGQSQGRDRGDSGKGEERGQDRTR